jgi:flagellar M-ring protein FliF
MKEQLLKYKSQFSETWNSFSKKQRLMIGGTFLFLLLTIGLFIYMASKPEYVPIYTQLSPAESGEIVAAIEGKGISVQISPDGTIVSVPKIHASKLKVELASAGIPKSGAIDYGVFSENMDFGMTDKQFDVIHRNAMQNELVKLIKQMDGVQDAKVMISLPEESVWIVDGEQTASASVLLTMRPGVELNEAQVKGLYHLISKSVPGLPVENIMMMDQNMRSYEFSEQSETGSSIPLHEQQSKIQRDIEARMQKELQLFLGRILGMDKVIVSVFANVDFSQQNEVRDLVEPVDKENNEGIAISVERIQESFNGQGTSMDGVAGTGETDIAGYPGADGAQNSEYEKTEERINREVNRIHQEIVSSPYMIKDLTINVGVEPPNVDDIGSLTPENINDIKTILRSVVRTSIQAETNNGVDLTDEQIDQKITVFANEFKGKPAFANETEAGISNNILYGLAAVAVLALGGVAFAFIRRARRKPQEEEDLLTTPKVDTSDFEFDQENPETARRKRIERLAQNNPDEFVKLLRTWISEE